MKRFLHRIWRLIPRELRRGALFLAFDLLAPRPTPGAARAFTPMSVAGVISARTGLAQMALSLLTRVSAMGRNAATVDLAGAFMSGGSGASDPEAPPAAAEQPGGALIVVINAPFMSLAMFHLGRRRTRGRYVVGYWAWELEALPADWRRGFSRCHEIWACSEFTARPIRALARCPVHVAPSIPADLTLLEPPPPKPSAGPFTVLVMFDMGSSFARKNPLAAIQAFRRAFGDSDGARLIVKMNHPDAYPAGAAAIYAAIEGASNITLTTESLDRAGTLALIASADALLSTHRAEGFGLPMFEAMLLERAVIATGWSANIEFMTADNAILLPYRLIPALDPQGTYTLAGAHWADADVGAAAQALGELAADPQRRRALGLAARRDALAYVGRQNAALRLLIDAG